LGQTATGVGIGTTAIRAVRLAVRDGQLELIAAGCKPLFSADNGVVSKSAGNPDSSQRDVSPVTVVDGPSAGEGSPPSGDQPTPGPAEGAPQAAPKRSSNRQEPEADPERERELRADLTSLLRRSGIRSGQMVLGLSGAQALIRYMQVPPVPPWKLDMMMKYEVQEQGSSSEPSAFDYRILDLPDVGGQVTIMLTQVQEKKLLGRLELARRAGMGRPDVDLNCLGLFNTYVHGHGFDGDHTVMVVDIGAENVDMVIARGPALCFARSVSGGGSRFTAAVAEMLRMPFAEAENLKCTKGAILAPDQAENEELPYIQRRLSAALESEIGTLAGVIDSSLMYCRAQTKQAKLRPDEVLLSGGGAMLPGLSEALARRLRMRVSRMEPFRKISLGALAGPELEEVSAQAPRYAVALGLAASRLLPDAVRFSMVQESEKARRRFLEGGIYMWYGAAVVWIAAAALIWAAWRNKEALASAQERRESLLSVAEDTNRQFEQSFANVEQRKHEIEALEERVYSGRDIVRVLSHLIKHTGGPYRDIVILEASNTPPAALSSGGRPMTSPSFQKARRVFVRGMATVRFDRSGGLAAEDAAVRQAQRLIEGYLVELQKQDQDNSIVSNVTAPLFPSDKEISKEGGQVKAPFVLEMALAPVEVAAAVPQEKKR
jgi:type IV pilus assembly protein PilM